MKKYLILIALLPILFFGQEGQKNFIDQNYIELTGKMELEIIPDEIYISITINERDKRDLTVEKQENLMIQKLKALGIDVNKNLSIIDFSGNYAKYFLKKNKVEKSKQYELLIHKTSLLPSIFKTLDAMNISNVSISKTDHSEIEKFKREIKIKALKIAKEKANNYAEAIDQTIGKALFIQEINSSNITNQLNGYTNGIMIRGLASPSYSSRKKEFNNIQLAKINLTATVLARFELK